MTIKVPPLVPLLYSLFPDRSYKSYRTYSSRETARLRNHVRLFNRHHMQAKCINAPGALFRTCCVLWWLSPLQAARNLNHPLRCDVCFDEGRVRHCRNARAEKRGLQATGSGRAAFSMARFRTRRGMDRPLPHKMADDARGTVGVHAVHGDGRARRTHPSFLWLRLFFGSV